MTISFASEIPKCSCIFCSMYSHSGTCGTGHTVRHVAAKEFGHLKSDVTKQMKTQNIGQSYLFYVDSRYNGVEFICLWFLWGYANSGGWLLVVGESGHLLPVSTYKNTHIQYIFMHIHCSALTETIALFQTHKNSAYGFVPFPSLAGHEGCLVGIPICTKNRKVIPSAGGLSHGLACCLPWVSVPPVAASWTCKHQGHICNLAIGIEFHLQTHTNVNLLALVLRHEVCQGTSPGFSCLSLTPWQEHTHACTHAHTLTGNSLTWPAPP